MRRNALATTVGLVSLFSALHASSATAQDLIWQVENPFRFFKATRSFALHEAASTRCAAIRRRCPTDIVWRTERKLNDPDCKDSSHPTSAPRPPASATSEPARLGGADPQRHLLREQRPAAPLSRRSASANIRGARAKEDYVLPDAHTVAIQIAPEQLAA